MFCFATCVSAQSTTPTQNPTQSGQSATQGSQAPTSHNNVAPDERQGDSDINREEVARLDQFLDSHREIADQLRSDPSLANDPKYLKDHPALQSYLQSHPEVRQQLQQNPQAFMSQEDRYDRREDAMNRNGSDFDRGNNGYDRDHNGDHEAQRRFGQFLGNHSDINDQLSKNPSLCKDDRYMHDHPELQSYPNSDPDVHQKLISDPDNFVKSTQQWSNTQSTAPKTTTQPATTSPTTSTPSTPAPKPKQ